MYKPAVKNPLGLRFSCCISEMYYIFFSKRGEYHSSFVRGEKAPQPLYSSKLLLLILVPVCKWTLCFNSWSLPTGFVEKLRKIVSVLSPFARWVVMQFSALGGAAEQG